MSAALISLVRARRPDVVALAIPLSLAVRIDPPLVRALRLALVPAADVATELALWSSPLVRTRGRDECALRHEVAAALWHELPTDPDALHALGAIYQRARADASPLVVLEERLAYLARLAALGHPADDGTSAAAAIDHALRAVIAAMSADPARRRDLASWSARALGRLPAIVRDTEAARILAATAAAWVAAPPDVATLAPPSPEGVSLARRLSPAGARRTLAVRRLGTRLELVPGAHDPPWINLEIASSPPALVIDDDRVIRLPRDERVTLGVGPRDVTLGDGAGQRWLIPAAAAPPELGAIATLIGTSGPGYAYLIGPELAVTSARLLGTAAWTGTLWFAHGEETGRVAAFDLAADCAILALGRPVEATAFALTTDAHVNAVWRAYAPDLGPRASPSRRGVQSWHGRVAAAWPALHLDGAGGPSSSLGPSRPGTPFLVDGRVIGHLVERPGDSPLCPARVVAWWNAEQMRPTAAVAPRSSAQSESADEPPPDAPPDDPARHVTIIVSGAVPPFGLLSARRAAGDPAGARVYRTTGRPPWRITLVDPTRGTGDGTARGPHIAIQHRPFTGAIEDARPTFLPPVPAPGLGELITVASIPALPPEHALRRALRFALERLVTRDDAGARPYHRVYTEVPGIGQYDITTIADQIATRDADDARVIEIDPEVDLLTILSHEPATTRDALRFVNASVARILEDGDPRDTLFGLFGVVSSRRRRHFTTLPDGDDIQLFVASIDRARPLRGYVTFWLPPALSRTPIRVHAKGGLATYSISHRLDYTFTVGAVVENEGLALEARVTSSRPASRADR